MSIEKLPESSVEINDVLSLREQVLVKSASVIDEQRCQNQTQIFPEGRWNWSDWTNVADGTRFQLQEQVQRINPEETHLAYRLLGYKEAITEPHIEFKYDSFKTKIVKKNEKGKYRKASQDDIEILLHCLKAAPTSEVDGIDDMNQMFVDTMRFSNIHDMRFRAQLKRDLSSFVLRLLQRDR